MEGLFEIKELDYMQTKKRVEQVVEVYERCLMRINSNVTPKITQTFTLDMPSHSNQFKSSTENAVIYKAEGICKDEAYIRRVTNCINRMTTIYREIIWLSFFEELSNDEVADKLKISTSMLSIRKRTAIELFAYGMGIEVYK